MLPVTGIYNYIEHFFGIYNLYIWLSSSICMNIVQYNSYLLGIYTV